MSSHLKAVSLVLCAWLLAVSASGCSGGEDLPLPCEGGGCGSNVCEPNPCTAPHKTSCSVREGRAVCACVSGYVLNGEACEPEPKVTCASQHPAGDAYEPDECPVLARRAGELRDEAHTLSPAGDQDWFQFTAQAGHRYEAVANGAAGERLYLDLYASDGTTALASDRAGEARATVQHKAGVSAELLVRVWAPGTGEAGAYTFSWKDLGTDDHGDTQATATFVSPSSTANTGRIETLGDADWFVFSGAANAEYAFSCVSSDIQCAVVLHDATGTVLQSNTGPSTSATVTYLARTAGTFAVKVSSGTPTVGPYTWQLKLLNADDHGDTPATATPVMPSASAVSARLETASDVDVFSFTAVAGHIYQVECGTSAFNCDLVLLGPSGATVASDTGSATSALLRAELNVPGTYSFRVQSGSAASGAYTYRLQDLGLDDHGDTLATATPVTPSTTGTPARFELSGDEDWFSFTAQTDHLYEFTCSSASTDCNLFLLDAAGTVLVSDDALSVNARVRWEAPSSGTLYLRAVAARAWSATSNSYAYRLQDLGLDDHGDTPATATPITTSTASSSGKLETPGDADWFAFAGARNTSYEFSCTAYSVDCNLVLQDPNGVVVQSDTSPSTSAKVTYKALITGTYFVKVASGTSAWGDYSYQLKIVAVDDHGDLAVSATPIAPSTTATAAKFEVYGDEDWFSFTAQANHFYDFTCTGTTLDCNVYLVDAAGTTLASDTTSSTRAYVSRKLSTGGTYFLRAVYAGIAASNNGYTYQLQDLGVEDHGDTQATATPIAPSSTATAAKFELSGDEDWFSFTAQTGRVYDFSCTSTGLDCNVYLVDAAGTTVTSDTSTSKSASVHWEFNTGGTYYLRVVYAGAWSASQGYTYRLQDLGMDDHGDTQATATPITPSSSTVAARFDVMGDEDWFSFTIQADHIYDFTCAPASPRCDVYLVNAAGTTVDVNISSSGSTYLRWRFETGGTYFLRAVHGGGWSPSSNGYTYQFRDLGMDDHGNTPATATPIQPSTAAPSANFEMSGDEDWFSFTAQANHIYDFGCGSASIFCGVALVDSAGRTLVSDPVNDRTASVRWRATADETYFVRVLSGTWSSNTLYRYQLEDLGVEDDHGDTQTKATPLLPSTTAKAARFELPGDVDWFSFTAQAGRIYDFTCNNSRLNCDVSLVDAAGTTVVADNASSASATVRWEFSTGGTYYLRVSFAGNWSSDDGYSYQLQDLGVDDHGDTPATATSLSPYAPAKAAKFEVSGDEDWFSITVEARRVYDFTCTPTGLNCDVYLVDAAGTTVASDTALTFKATVRWKFNTEGTYFLRVVHTGAWSSNNGYTYQARDLGLDDHADTFTGATELSRGKATAGSLEASGDLDFFSVMLNGALTTRVITTGIFPTITVYAPDKTTVLATGYSPLTFTTVYAGGTHYLRLGSTNTGSYTVKVE